MVEVQLKRGYVSEMQASCWRCIPKRRGVTQATKVNIRAWQPTFVVFSLGCQAKLTLSVILGQQLKQDAVGGSS